MSGKKAQNKTREKEHNGMNNDDTTHNERFPVQHPFILFPK
jgi:hypothetical protein